MLINSLKVLFSACEDSERAYEVVAERGGGGALTRVSSVSIPACLVVSNVCYFPHQGFIHTLSTLNLHMIDEAAC